MDFDNFTIRNLMKEDASNFYFFIENNRERIAKYFPTTISAVKDTDSTISFIDGKIELSKKREFFYFIILDNEAGKIAGSVILKNFDWQVEKCEISYFIDRNYEGKGIMTKSLSVISEHCFKNLKLNKVFLRIAEDNFSSRKVAEKNGFIHEGILRQDFKISEGNWIDVVYYGLINPFKEKK